MEAAIDLLEYVAVTGGAEHLKSNSRKLNWVQYYSLDTLFGLSIIFVIGWWLLSKIYKFALHVLFLSLRRRPKEKSD